MLEAIFTGALKLKGRTNEARSDFTIVFPSA